MQQFTLPYFGTIGIENITEEQEFMKIDFQGREIILMWFAEEEIADEYWQNAQSILSDLKKFDKENHILLEKEWQNADDKTVIEYLEFHLEEIPQNTSQVIENIVNRNSTKAENLQKLLKSLKLVTIAFHDDEIVADYVLDNEVSDEILAIHMENDGNKYISHES